MQKDIFITGAKRTPVASRGGAFSAVPVHELSSSVIGALALDGPAITEIDLVVVGNALYGGGNPARLVSLAAGISESVPAMTVDTQCCSGIDAVLLLVDAMKSGRSFYGLAGGVESFSRSPIRMHRRISPEDGDVPYYRPAFTPWPDRDPDMLVAAADLAAAKYISRPRQEIFAVESHRKACEARAKETIDAEIVPVNGISQDEFTRNLGLSLCERLPALAGVGDHAITTATTAVESDAAAFVMLETSPRDIGPAVRIRDSLNCGADPRTPGLAPIDATRQLLARNNLQPDDLACVEIMEAFAAQAIAFIDAFQFSPTIVNISGGALARGHPIGASGSILVVRLVHELRHLGPGSLGLAAIAGAGGLASCILLERV